MKLLIIGDVHFGQNSTSTTHPGVWRQSNTQSLDAIEKLLELTNKQDFDQFIWMGDYIRDEGNPNNDAQNLSTILNKIHKCKFDSIYLIGNHEQRALTEEKISEIFSQNQIQLKFWGKRMVDNWQILWIDSIFEDHRVVSDQRLAWLEQQLKSHPQSLIFSHYSLLPINSAGSFYFENFPEAMYYANTQIIIDLISKYSVPIAINAHNHIVSCQKENNTWFITAPAFSEKIASDHESDFHPGVYSILEITDNQFVFSSYSWEFCFAKVQGKLQ